MCCCQELTAIQRPDLVAPILTPLTHKRDKQAPGYYFVGLYLNEQEGLYIYDNDLVSPGPIITATQRYGDRPS